MRSFEKYILGFALFLSLIPLVGVLLGFLRLTVWSIVLPLCLAITMKIMWNRDSDEKQFSVWEGLAIGVFLISLVMFMSGSFAYPWLEDDDPYGYAVISDHILQTQSFMKSTSLDMGSYVEPNAVGYSVFMANFIPLLGSIPFTLKVMNALIVSLSILFSFYFFRRFLKSDTAAFFGTFVLAALPSFQTHFIFAQALAVMMFLPAFYFVERSKKDWKMVVPAALIIGSMFMTHHLTIFAFGIFFIIYLVLDIRLNVFLCGLFGCLVGGIYWGYGISKYGFVYLLTQIGVIGSEPLIGTGTRNYLFKDFFLTSPNNLINVSTGWGPGVFLCLLGALALFIFVIIGLYKDSVYAEPRDMGKSWAVVWIWFIVALIGVLSVYLPVQILPFRWWTFLAIPVAMLCGMFLGFCWKYEKTSLKLILVSLAILIVLFTFIPKWQINNSQWMPAGSIVSANAINGLLWAEKNIGGSDVYSFETYNKFQGFNLHYCLWCFEDNHYATPDQPTSLIKDPGLMADRLKDWGYDYLLINNWYVISYGQNVTMQFFNNVANDTEHYEMIHSDEGGAIFRIK